MWTFLRIAAGAWSLTGACRFAAATAALLPSLSRSTRGSALAGWTRTAETKQAMDGKGRDEDAGALLASRECGLRLRGGHRVPVVMANTHKNQPCSTYRERREVSFNSTAPTVAERMRPLSPSRTHTLPGGTYPGGREHAQLRRPMYSKRVLAMRHVAARLPHSGYRLLHMYGKTLTSRCTSPRGTPASSTCSGNDDKEHKDGRRQ